MATVILRHFLPFLPGSDIQIQSGKLLRGGKCLPDHIGTGKATVGVLINIQLAIIRRAHLGGSRIIGQSKNILQIELTVRHLQERIVDTVPVVMQLCRNIIFPKIFHPFDLQFGQIQMVAKASLSLFSGRLLLRCLPGCSRQLTLRKYILLPVFVIAAFIRGQGKLYQLVKIGTFVHCCRIGTHLTVNSRQKCIRKYYRIPGGNILLELLFSGGVHIISRATVLIGSVTQGIILQTVLVIIRFILIIIQIPDMRIDQPIHGTVIVNGLIVFHIHGSGAGTHIDHIISIVEILYLANELCGSHLGNGNPSTVTALPQKSFHGICR